MGLSSRYKEFRNGKTTDPITTSPEPSYNEKSQQYDAAAIAERRHSATGDGRHVDDMTDPTTRLHRGLQARQVTMIAIGGAIGTGLIIGTGASLAKAGPLSILISYSIVGFIVYMVMCAFGGNGHMVASRVRLHWVCHQILRSCWSSFSSTTLALTFSGSSNFG